MDILKSWENMTWAEHLGVRAGLLKANNVPVDQVVGSSLNPSQIREFWSREVEGTVLERYKRINSKKTTGDLNVFSWSDDDMYRPVNGTTPTTLATSNTATVSNVGNKWTLERGQRRFWLPYDTIQDNYDNPSFKAERTKEFESGTMNQISKLALQGTDDDGSEFIKLNKGFIQVAKDTITAGTDPVHLVDYGNYTDMFERMQAAIDALPDKYQGDYEFAFELNPTDFNLYKRLMASLDSRGDKWTKGEALPFEGYRVLVNRWMPSSTFHLTRLDKNLCVVFGDYEGAMRFSMKEDDDAVAYKVLYNSMFDFAIADNDAYVLCYDAA